MRLDRSHHETRTQCMLIHAKHLFTAAEKQSTKRSKTTIRTMTVPITMAGTIDKIIAPFLHSTHLPPSRLLWKYFSSQLRQRGPREWSWQAPGTLPPAQLSSCLWYLEHFSTFRDVDENRKYPRSMIKLSRYRSRTSVPPSHTVPRGHRKQQSDPVVVCAHSWDASQKCPFLHA